MNRRRFPDRHRIIARWLAGAVVALAGVALLTIGHGALATGLACAAVGLGAALATQARLAVDCDEDGLTECHLGRRRTVSWDDIEAVEDRADGFTVIAGSRRVPVGHEVRDWAILREQIGWAMDERAAEGEVFTTPPDQLVAESGLVANGPLEWRRAGVLDWLPWPHRSIVVDQAGIHARPRYGSPVHYPWSCLRAYEMKNGHLLLRTTRGDVALPWDFPHAEKLRVAVQEVVASRKKGVRLTGDGRVPAAALSRAEDDPDAARGLSVAEEDAATRST